MLTRKSSKQTINTLKFVFNWNKQYKQQQDGSRAEGQGEPDPQVAGAHLWIERWRRYIFIIFDFETVFISY